MNVGKTYNLNVLVVMMLSLVQTLWSLSENNKNDARHKALTRQEQDEYVSSIIRKSILTGINQNNKEEKRISDQVEPLIKKMFRKKKNKITRENEGKVIGKAKSIPFQDEMATKFRVNLGTVKAKVEGQIRKNESNTNRPLKKKKMKLELLPSTTVSPSRENSDNKDKNNNNNKTQSTPQPPPSSSSFSSSSSLIKNVPKSVSVNKNTVEENSSSVASAVVVVGIGSVPTTKIDQSLNDDEDEASGSNSGDGGSGDKDDNNNADDEKTKIPINNKNNNNNNGFTTTNRPLQRTERTRFTRTRKPATTFPAAATKRTNNQKTIPAEWSKVDINRYVKTTESPQLRFYNDKRLAIHYYGPCLFCDLRSSLYFGQFEREMKRKQFRTVLLNYDFAFLVQKYPSGLYATILSFNVGRTTFPAHHYLEIHAPLSCGCFAKAPNTRYIVAGSKFAGKYILNAFYPLYEVNSFEDVELIQNVMKNGKPLRFNGGK